MLVVFPTKAIVPSNWEREGKALAKSSLIKLQIKQFAFSRINIRIQNKELPF